MTIARVLIAKTLEVSGLVLVGMALLIGVRDDAMGKEILTLLLGGAVFLSGYFIEPRE